MPLTHQVTLAAGNHVAGFAIAAVVLVIGVGCLALFISALVSILRSGVSGGMKLVWIVFAFVAPVLGSLIWFIFGRPDARRRTALA